MFSFLTNFFANPAMVGGALAGSIPVIIHLLNRQRFKRVIWAAMHWLWASYKKSQRRLQIEQLILLLIRILILIILAFALARPALQEGMGLITGRASLHRIIVLDNSYSMGQLVGGRTLFEKAKEKAAELTHKLSLSDEVDVLLANSMTEELTATSSTAKQEVANQIRAAQLSDGGTDIPRAIAAACRLINERKSKNARKEIIVITDRTRYGWETSGQPRRLTADDEAAIEKAFAGKSRPKIMVMRLPGEKDCDNLAAAKLEVEEKVIPARGETLLVATIANYSGAVRGAKAKLKVDGEEVASEFLKSLSADPQKPETVSFRYTFPEPGSHWVAVELEGDVLAADNTCFLAVDVEDQMRVLCVDGEQRTEAQCSEMDYFRQALSPAKSEELNAGRMPLYPDVISDAMLPEANLDNYRLVVLGNVAMVPPEKIQALERWVKTGGALWVFLGNRCDPAIYNKDFANLLPMNLGEVVGSEDPEAHREALSDKEISHPAIQKFQGIKDWSLSHLVTHRRYKLVAKPQAELSVRTVLAYENGDPAAVERKLEDGRVVLFGTTADKAWNNWPMTNRYMPLMNFIALDLIQPAYVQRNRTVGERFIMQLPRQDLGAARREGVRLIDPHGESSSMEVFTEQSRIESATIKRAGPYTAQLPGDTPRALHFAANRNCDESDLTPIDDRDILAKVTRGEGGPERAGYFKTVVTQDDFDVLADEVKDVEEKLKKHTGSREIWRWLAGTVLVLLFIESILARRFGDFTR